MSKVSRSVYQKVCEENKKLKADIKLLVLMTPHDEWAEVYYKWDTLLKEEIEFKSLMRMAAAAYAKEHPEFNPQKP